MTEDDDPDKEAMTRWQGYARESRTAVNSHFLAYSAAILALQASTLLDSDVKVISWPCGFILAGLLAVVSLVLGSTIVLLRLRDARLTARIVRYRQTKRAQEDIQKLRASTDCLGWWTNKLIPWQVISFAGSALMFCVWVVSSSWSKLS